MKTIYFIALAGAIAMAFSFSKEFYREGLPSENEAMISAANSFIATLGPDQKQKAVIAFDLEERYNWHFVPKDDRKGLPIKEMNDAQLKAAMALLQTALSKNGYEKTRAIIELENVLKELEHRKEDDHFRDPGKYFFTIFGNPGKNEVWAWRLEGHHISFNFSSANNELVSGTPGFMGSNPGIVRSGPQTGKQVLKEETEKAFLLLQSFDESQLNKAVISGAVPGDIITYADKKAEIREKAGISYSALNKDQQSMLTDLLMLYLNRYKKSLADAMMTDIRNAGIDKLSFAWVGGKQNVEGNKHYYRIQGPTIIIEYDNTQNNANHVHTVIRDLQKDFGGDALLEHYKKDHHH